MNKKTSKLLSEAKSDLELAIVKSLCKAPLNPTELDEVLSITEADLLKDHDLDLYMTQQIKYHAKNEQFRLRAQNLYTPIEGAEDFYPEKPYTRTNPIDESSSDLRRKNKMKITKNQLRRIIKEEKAKILAEQKVRRAVRRKLLEQAGGHTVTGNHEGQEFSVQLPDALARTILDAHAALLATSPTGAAEDGDDSSPEGIAFGDSVRQVYAFVDEEVAKQTGVPVHPRFGINGEYHMDGSQMSDVLNDAGNYL